MATASLPIFKWIHLLSHCFSCGQTRPQTAGRALVSFKVLAASKNSPRSIFLIKVGILIFTGHPCIQVGFGQSRQRSASCIACSFVKPKLTSSKRVRLRYSGSNSFIFTRGISARSLFFLLLRSASRQGSARRAAINSSVVMIQLRGFIISSLYLYKRRGA